MEALRDSPHLVVLKASSEASIMAALKFLLCLFLLFACFPSSETRPPTPFFNESDRPLIEIAKEVFKSSIARKAAQSFEPNRLSPGRPDPRHH